MSDTHPALDLHAWSRAVSDSSVWVADGSNVKVTVRNGCLSVVDGPPGQQRARMLARVPREVTRLIILARRGYISLEALRWVNDCRMSVTHLAEDITMTSGSHEGDWRLAKAQLDPPLALAHYLIGEKIRGQAQVIIRRYGENPVSRDLRELSESITDAFNVQMVRGYEGKAGTIYWDMWRHAVRINWTPSDLVIVPAHWRTYPGRPTMAHAWKSNRYATDPINAMLNYAYKVLESETLHACRSVGLHPDFGVIHPGKTDRHAFVLDLMEPVRPFCDSLVWHAAERIQPALGEVRYFDRRWCHELRDGQVVLDPPLTHEISGWCSDIGSVVQSHAVRVKEILRNG